MLKNKEIAKILGVSLTSVSLAINNRPGVSERTRKKVLTLRKYGPEALRDDFCGDKINTQKILMIIHKTSGSIIVDKPFFSDLIESAQTKAVLHGYALEVNYKNNEDLQNYVKLVNNQNYAGALLLATEMQENDYQTYKQLQIPFVLIDGSFDFEECDSITIGDYNDIVRAFKYAYDMGHRRIGYLRSNVQISNFEHRYDGYQKALRLFSLEKDLSMVFSLGPNVVSAYEDMTRVLGDLPEDYEMPTCFLCDLDYIAFGAINALCEYGYKIPEDVSIIGFDDVSACEVCNPPLTTMSVNRTDIGRLAVGVLMEKIKKSGFYNAQVQISSKLIIRESVCERKRW